MAAERQVRRRCAVYTRKSSEEGLDQAFNSLDAQREACEAYIKSQAGEGWRLIRTPYDDGGISGGTLEPPALQQLLDDIRARRIETVVVYKVDRLTRSLADFAKIVEVFDAHAVSFVSVTQQFNTTTSMGRLTLNMLLSFAQFEREVTGERIRDKIAASKKKGLWMGGFVPLGYEAKERTLVINEIEAETVRTVFRLYLEQGTVRRVKEEADRLGLTTKLRQTEEGRMRGSRPLSRGYIYKLLGNPLYVGRIAHKGETYEGRHPAIIDNETWQAVQAKLAGNTQARRSGNGRKDPSLLAGMIDDGQGNRFTPSHAVKNGVRYRYYVNQAVIQQRDHLAGAMTRLPAKEIEALVAVQIKSLLSDMGRLVDELGGPLAPRNHKRLIAASGKLIRRWSEMQTSERRAFLLTTETSVTVREEETRITLSRQGLRSALIEEAPLRERAAAPTLLTKVHDENAQITIECPSRLKLCSGEMRLVIPPNDARALPPRINGALINAIVRAHKWKDRLVSGPTPSTRAIAREESLTERPVGRTLRLAFLAPDIVEAILDGLQPADLELKQLLEGIPLSWYEQRRKLGFSSDH